MRTQITVYLRAEMKSWLRKYAGKCGLKESEVVRFLVKREMEVGWLKWALSVRDPDQGSTASSPRRKVGPLPRSSEPLKKRPGQKTKKRAIEATKM
ncbi:MAG: hypothetical protein ACHQRJ_21495 [Alphaproteobacteria bacterium]